jgi:HAD superfamily hydrolase (TIGR01549 family)
MAAAPRLACFDLDNTLIDRDASFLAWARWWVEREGLGEDAVEWLLAKERFELSGSVDQLVEAYDREHPLFTWVEEAVLDGLASLRTAGWRVAVVTNGGTVQQNIKLEHTGIGAAVDYNCISETVGVRKPDRRIFEIAATETGATLTGGWMVGDHPSYDIAGGINADLNTIRIGTYHQVDTPAADHHLPSVLDAFPLILAS